MRWVLAPLCTRGSVAACAPCPQPKAGEGLDTGIRETPGVGRNRDARAGTGTHKKQVQHDRGLHAGTTTTTDTVDMTDKEARAGAQKAQVLHRSHGEDHEQEESQVQEAGELRSKDRKKAAKSTSGSEKHSTVNRHIQGLPCHKQTVNHTN